MQWHVFDSNGILKTYTLSETDLEKLFGQSQMQRSKLFIGNEGKASESIALWRFSVIELTYNDFK